MDEIDDWRALLAAQAGIVTRQQLLARGFSDAAIRAHVAARRWTPVMIGV